MKLFKNILLVVVALVAGLAVVGFFLPSHYRVARTLVINAKPDAVFPWINSLKKWPEWSAWNASKDPTLVYSYEGPETGAGAISRWEAKKLGQGEMKITASEPDRSVQFDLNFEHGKYRSTGGLVLQPEGDATRARFYFEGDSGANPIGRYFNLLMDRMVGPDFEEGLTNLKRKVEGK